MQSAPAVSYPVGRSFFHAGVVVGVLALGAVVLAAWAVHRGDLYGRVGMCAGVWLVCVLVGYRGWAHTHCGTLSWDGHAWTWGQAGDAACPVSTEVVLDTQSTVLLRLVGDAQPPFWVWPERRTQPQRWLALRRAIYARPTANSSAHLDVLSNRAGSAPP